MKQLSKYFVLSLIAGAACFFLFSGTSSAATIDVVAGTDENTDNASCSLTEAITNINGQATNEPDCVPTGAYGTDDTINLPTGTITLSADLPQITESLTIAGQGMGESIIDGDGQWKGFSSVGDGFTASGFTMTSLEDMGMLLTGGSVSLQNLEVDGANWSISDPLSVAGAIVIGNDQALNDTTVAIDNVFIHNFDIDVSQFFSLGVASAGNNSVELSAANVTVYDIANAGITHGILFGTGLFDNGAGTGSLSGVLSNITINNVHSSANVATGLVTTALTQGTNTLDISARNFTIVDVSGVGTNPFIPGQGGASIAVVGGALTEATINLDLTNFLVDSSTFDTCVTGDISGIIGGAGTVNTNITSSGGNLSDDSSCAPYFTEPTDQNNVSGLAASLSPLADNGGYVPTMALLEGSPAVDSGVTVSGLTTDARLATRPQGNAYDSGAYESPYTKPDPLTDDGEGLAESGAMIVGIVVIAVILVGGGLMTTRKPKTTKTKSPKTKK